MATERTELEAELRHNAAQADQFLAPILEDAADAVAELARTQEALREYEDCASWYVRCLEDVQDRRPVRGLAEAKAGYDAARDKVAALAEVPPHGRTSDEPRLW
jgi:hypothetical protein